MSIVERYLIQCPLFGVSVKRDSTVHYSSDLLLCEHHFHKEPQLLLSVLIQVQGTSFFSNIEAKRQRNGLLSVGWRTNSMRRDIKVGSILHSSNHTVSQLKCFTASILSLKILSWLVEHKTFNSFWTARATVEIVDFLPAIEVSGAEVNIESLLRANLLTAFLRQGVRM